MLSALRKLPLIFQIDNLFMCSAPRYLGEHLSATLPCLIEEEGSQSAYFGKKSPQVQLIIIAELPKFGGGGGGGGGGGILFDPPTIRYGRVWRNCIWRRVKTLEKFY